MSAEKKPLWPLIAMNLALLCMIGAIIYYTFAPTSAPQTGSKIPAFGMQSLDGAGFGDGDLQGELFVLNIFASWCAPCEAEFPVLHELIGQTDIPLYGIAVQDSEEKLRQFLERLGDPFVKIGMDNGGLMLSGLGISGLPTTLLVDSDMNILWSHMAPLTSENVKQDILPLIQNYRK